MTVTLLPDAEALLVQFLLDQAEVTAFMGGSGGPRIYTALPSGLNAWPTVRVTRIGGAPVTNLPLHLDAALLQVDVWGGPKATTRDLAETIRQVIADRIIGTHPEGVVTKPEFGPLSYLPDNTYSPARPRYSGDVTLYTHA